MSELETGAVASCTGCAAPLRLEARFCSRCGAPVGGGDRPADAIAPVPTARWVELRSALQLWVRRSGRAARLVRVGGRREALVVQAAMFSILHLLPAVFVSHFLIGLTLGWLRQRTDSLLPGMLAHGLYNGTLLAIGIWA